MYLHKRNKIFQLRITIPVDCKKYFADKKEICKSLKTESALIARQQAKLILGKFEKVYMTIRTGILTESEIKRYIDSEIYEKTIQDLDAVQKNEAILNETNFYNAILERIGKSYNENELDNDEKYNELLANKRTSVEKNREILARNKSYTKPDIVEIANNVMGELELNYLPESKEFRKLCDMIQDADLRATKVHLKHLQGDFETDYDKQREAKKNSYRLSALIKQYESEKSGNRHTKSGKTFGKRILHIMGDVYLQDITRDTCLKFRDALKEYPSGNTDYKTNWKVLTEKNKRLLSETTVNNMLVYLASLTGYGNDFNLGIEGSPAKGLAKDKTQCTSDKPRVPYTTNDLNSLVIELGKINRTKYPERFWIPLILLFTGARANEICQLDTMDILESVEGYSFNLLNDTKNLKSIKNEGSRVVPMHPELIKLGLIEYISSQKEKRCLKLFSNLEYKIPKDGKDGSWAIAIGRWYNRTFKGTFIKDVNENERKDLHSFRTGFIQQRENDEVDFYILQLIVGHKTEISKSVTTQHYGARINVETRKREYMNRISYGIDFSTLYPA